MTPNFSGSWKADLAKSKILGTPAKEFLVEIAHSGNLISMNTTVTRMDGSVERVPFSVLTNGAECTNLIRGITMYSRANWVGEELVIESTLNAGGRELHFKDHWALGPDGKSMTMEHRDDDLAGQFTYLQKL